GPDPGGDALLHGFTAFVDEANRVGEGDDPGGAQGGELAEAVAGERVGVEVVAAGDGEGEHRLHERGELRVAGGDELVGVGVQQQVADVAAADVTGFGHQFPRRVVDVVGSHSGLLASLAGKHEAAHARSS